MNQRLDSFTDLVKFLCSPVCGGRRTATKRATKMLRVRLSPFGTLRSEDQELLISIAGMLEDELAR